MATPIWLTVLLAVIASAVSGGIAFYAATRSAAARYASKQLASADRKSERDKQLSVVFYTRVEREHGLFSELILVNLCSDLIFVYGAMLEDGTALDLDTRTAGKIKNALKPAEETVWLRFANLQKINGNPSIYFDGDVNRKIEVFIYMATDPDYIHTHFVEARNGKLRTSKGRRLTEEEYETMVTAMRV